MTTSDITSAPASALVRAIRAREISSRELLDAYLDRIEQINPAINAVVTIDADAARAAAATRMTRRLAVRNSARSTGCR